MFLTKIFFQTIRFMDKEVCHHLWRSCANDSSRKGLFQRQPPKASDPRNGSLQDEVMSLGDKQGWSESHWGLAWWSENRGTWTLGLKPPIVHKKRDPLLAGLFLPVKRVSRQNGISVNPSDCKRTCAVMAESARLTAGLSSSAARPRCAAVCPHR